MKEEKKTLEEKKRQRFSLEKIKLLKNSAVDLHYSYTVMDGSIAYELKEHTECPVVPHPDLTDSFKKMIPMIARIYFLTFFREIIAKEEFEATKSQADYAEKFYQSILERITITGVAISGAKDSTRGCVITATFTSESNVPMPINSHRIRFTETRYGFEQELEEICESIEDESFQYLFEGKQAQLDLFQNSPNEQGGSTD